mgnify:CR=1 FL=1
MALTSTTFRVTAKSKYEDNGTIKNRTIVVISDALSNVDLDDVASEVINKLQPVTTDSLTGEVTITRTHTYTNNVTVPAGVDMLDDSNDQIIYKLENDTTTKTVTLKNAAAVDPVDSARWATLTAAVNDYGNMLTTYTEGDFTITDASLRAYTDYNFDE